MGSEFFVTVGKGKTAEDAFHEARERAYYDYGHRGYTGSLAEKDTFVMVEKPDDDESAESFAEGEERGRNPIANYKWGPCCCVKGDEEDEWVFYGRASS